MTDEAMPAAVYVGDGEIEVRDLPIPSLHAGQALVEVAYCGICGTDLHLVLDRFARPGSVLGHEWSGTLVATAPDVEGWEVGARVVADVVPACGRCRACRRGRPAVCGERATPDFRSFGGAFCRYVAVDAARLLRVPDELSTRVAALTEPTAIAMHTVTLSGAQPEDRVLVTGAGPVGLLTVAVLRAHGIHDVTVSEPSAARRERALLVGASAAITPDDLGRPGMARPVDEPFGVVIECSGRAAAIESAFDQLDRAGTLVFVGTGPEQARLDHNRAILLELTVVGAYNYDAAGFAPALDLLASGAMPLDALVEPFDVGLDEMHATMLRLADGELAGKVMVTPTVADRT